MFPSEAGAAGRPATLVPVSELLNVNPAAFCVSCKGRAVHAAPHEQWTVWLDREVYCPTCARHRHMDQADALRDRPQG